MRKVADLWTRLALLALVAVIGLASVMPVEAAKGGNGKGKGGEQGNKPTIALLEPGEAYPDAAGKARSFRKAGKERLHVTVEGAEALVGSTLTVFVDGVEQGTMEIEDGEGSLHLKAR